MLHSAKAAPCYFFTNIKSKNTDTNRSTKARELNEFGKNFSERKTVLNNSKKTCLTLFVVLIYSTDVSIFFSCRYF